MRKLVILGGGTAPKPIIINPAFSSSLLEFIRHATS